MLELRGISAGYDTGQVLHDITLVVPDHSVVALLGANGAGKTTLLRVASGLLSPTAGQIVIDGEDVTGRPAHHLARLGVCHVPEGRGVFPALTVSDNIRMQAASEGKRSAMASVADVFPRLGERAGQLAGTMSGGERQMLALAHAYVGEPSVALLDEVSMGLAPNIVDEIYVYLHGLAEKGTALLLVEQYVRRALELADYVYVLDRGRIAFAGEPAELDDSAIIQSYLGAIPA
jgi:branched-chain amino acid transport system ATP-binding protein